MSSEPATPRTVTVTPCAAEIVPDVPFTDASVGSECGAAAAAVSVTFAVFAPLATLAGAAVTPFGRPVTASSIASSKPVLRVTVASTSTLVPCRITAFCVDSASVKLAAGGGLVPGSEPWVGWLLGVPPSEPPPPQAARASVAACSDRRVRWWRY